MGKASRLWRFLPFEKFRFAETGETAGLKNGKFYHRKCRRNKPDPRYCGQLLKIPQYLVKINNFFDRTLNLRVLFLFIVHKKRLKIFLFFPARKIKTVLIFDLTCSIIIIKWFFVHFFGEKFTFKHFPPSFQQICRLKR